MSIFKDLIYKDVTTSLPLTLNEHGLPDGGDGLANLFRLLLIATYNKTYKHGDIDESVSSVIDGYGICKRSHKYVSIYSPEESLLLTNSGPDFWTNPNEVSRDQMRALMWMVEFNNRYPLALREEPLLTTRLKQVASQYRSRGYMMAQNKDLMLPTFMLNKPVLSLIRDLEMGVNLAMVCGLIPMMRHDKPWGFGKGKKFMFSWQDSDWCDGDVNMLVDFIGASMLYDSIPLKVMKRIYKIVRGSRFIKHYYRKESGNNPVIGERFAEIVESFSKV